ncbi:MAG: hypothetical protein AAF985_24205 [Bacteroidota bacterium]
MISSLKYYLLFGLFLMACQPAIDPQLLHGEWKAAHFIENGVASDIDLRNVLFTFNADGTYAYHGTFQLEESGRYYLTGKLLYTTDTTANQSIEKSVKIAKITKDSMYFQMNAGGIPQIFKLYKTQ